MSLSRYHRDARKSARRSQRIRQMVGKTVRWRGQLVEVISADLRAATVNVRTSNGTAVFAERDFLSDVVAVEGEGG